MDLNSVLLLAFAAAFVVSIVDYWTDLGIWRAGIALGVCCVSATTLGLDWKNWTIAVLASSFVTMALLAIIERVNFRGRVR